MADFGWNSRKFLRVFFEADVWFRVHRSSKKDFHSHSKTIASKLLDLSVGGCAIESPILLPVGVKINVFINRQLFINAEEKLKKNKFSRISGTIRSMKQLPSRKFRLGVQFDFISKKDQDLVKRFIESRERREETRITFK